MFYTYQLQLDKTHKVIQSLLSTETNDSPVHQATKSNKCILLQARPQRPPEKENEIGPCSLKAFLKGFVPLHHASRNIDPRSRTFASSRFYRQNIST